MSMLNEQLLTCNLKTVFDVEENTGGQDPPIIPAKPTRRIPDLDEKADEDSDASDQAEDDAGDEDFIAVTPDVVSGWHPRTLT